MNDDQNNVRGPGPQAGIMTDLERLELSMLHCFGTGQDLGIAKMWMDLLISGASCPILVISHGAGSGVTTMLINVQHLIGPENVAWVREENPFKFDYLKRELIIIEHDSLFDSIRHGQSIPDLHELPMMRRGYTFTRNKSKEGKKTIESKARIIILTHLPPEDIGRYHLKHAVTVRTRNEQISGIEELRETVLQAFGDVPGQETPEGRIVEKGNLMRATHLKADALDRAIHSLETKKILHAFEVVEKGWPVKYVLKYNVDEVKVGKMVPIDLKEEA